MSTLKFDEQKDVFIGVKLPIQNGQQGYFDSSLTTIDQVKSNLRNLLLTIKGERLKAIGGDSYQAIIEFGRKPRAMSLVSYGNASQIGSKHRTDQLKFYSEKKLRPVWLDKTEINLHLEKREILNPN